MQTENNLTPVELELMDILWRLGEGNVHDVLANLPKQRTLAYTSVSTILRILQQKNIVTVKKIGRQHIYCPLLSKAEFARYSVKKMVKQIFSGNSAELVTYLVDQNELSLKEISEIQQRLNAKKKGVTA